MQAEQLSNKPAGASQLGKSSTPTKPDSQPTTPDTAAAVAPPTHSATLSDSGIGKYAKYIGKNHKFDCSV